MQEIKTIKNVDEETWREFKILAVKGNMKMPLLLKMMVNEFERSSIKQWNEILKGRAILDKKEAGEIEITVKTLRKEKGFRK